MKANQNERERQIERLINFINSNGDSREIKRALAVKLALQGYVYTAIGNILDLLQKEFKLRQAWEAVVHNCIKQQ
jgi:hypothetical protein